MYQRSRILSSFFLMKVEKRLVVNVRNTHFILIVYQMLNT